MLDPKVDNDMVDAIVAEISQRDRRLGQDVEFVWEALTAGEGAGMVSQAGLQQWLWWLLPKRLSDLDDLEAISEAGGVLFDRLGADRYAEICRGDVTASVFGAWRRSRSAGVKESGRAAAASGVEPPDIDGFEWGDVFGIWESAARAAAERRLEAAIDSGELDPGASGWRTVAKAITAEVLNEDPHGIGQSWRSLVTTERAEAALRSAPGRSATQPDVLTAQLLVRPPDPDPEIVEATLQPLMWLLDTCRDGATLTASMYLPPTIVREGVDKFDWWDWDKPPRSEADVLQLGTVRDTARELRLVQPRHRILKTTKAGLAVLNDPASLWDRFVGTLGGSYEYEHAISEILARSLIDAPHDFLHLIDSPQPRSPPKAGEAATSKSPSEITNGLSQTGCMTGAPGN